MRTARLFLLLVAHTVALRAADLPGTWSNDQDEFKTISLMLRADGQAVFATAVLPGFGLWEKTPTGIDLTLGGDGRSLTIPFTYHPDPARLRAKLHETEIELLKISGQEPPDMLARAKEKYAEQQARWAKMSRFDERPLRNRRAVRALLKKLRAETDPAKHPDAIFLSAGDQQGRLTLRGLGDRSFLEVVLESRHIADPTGLPLNHQPLSADAVSDLPLTFDLPTAQREALANLATFPGVKSETHAFGQVSAFKPEHFYRSIHFIVEPSAKPDALALTERILDILWPTPPPEIKATLHFRVPETP